MDLKEQSETPKMTFLEWPASQLEKESQSLKSAPWSESEELHIKQLLPLLDSLFNTEVWGSPLRTGEGAGGGGGKPLFNFLIQIICHMCTDFFFFFFFENAQSSLWN